MTTSKIDTIEGAVAEYVTAMIGGQLFGLPISRVQDVFMPERLTRVPLSPAEIAGVLNLRGRIVTVVDMRARLGGQMEKVANQVYLLTPGNVEVPPEERQRLKDRGYEA